MARLPMGWTRSGDYLHITTRTLLPGMDRAINIFDDLLLQPHSGTEAYQLGAKILCQAIQRNLKFSKTKFQVSPEVVFCGLQLSTQSNGKVSIQPDKSRIERILDLPCPTSKEEVQSLLGLLGTLMLWFPNLSITTDPIRDLLRKNVHFLWTREHSDCLSLIKEKLGNLLVLSPFVPTRPSYIFTDASLSGILLTVTELLGP